MTHTCTTCQADVDAANILLSNAGDPVCEICFHDAKATGQLTESAGSMERVRFLFALAACAIAVTRLVFVLV